MPPRVRPSNFSAVASCPAVRPQSVSLPVRTSREFSQTSCQQVTARRRRFYEWLNGPGAQLKKPLPGSTNYLGAYDQFGNLIRAGPNYQRKDAEAKKADGSDPASTEVEEGAEAAEAKKPEEETLSGDEAKKVGNERPSAQETDHLDQAVVRVEKKAEKGRKGEEEDAKLPPETLEDLRPFPKNRFFRSQPVLSEELREAIYQRVVRDGATVSLASVEFGVSNERVGAVVRLKQMEKEWVAQGKTLALPYAKAVLEMVPTTPYIDTSVPENKGKRPVTHEPINDLIVHPATRQQLFVPVAESRQFTRVDAGKAFDNNLLPADERIPHPELVLAERELNAGLSFQERKKLAEQRLQAEQEKKRAEDAKKLAKLAALKVVPKRRWDFVFEDISVEKAGKDGRGPNGVGWRYGFPHEDRKKGQVKIPTKVDA